MSTKQYTLEKHENEESQNLQAKLVYIASAKYGKDWHSSFHSHRFAELFYVVSGQGEFYIENEHFEVKADDLVIVNPNINHTETSKPDDPLEYIVIGVDGLYLLNEKQSPSPFYSLHHFQNHKTHILFYLQNLLLEIVDKKEMHDLVIQNLLEILLVNVLRLTQTKLSLASSTQTNHHASYLKSYIDEHFKEKLTLESLASISYMNKYYMLHNFKKYIGSSPIAYLNLKRLEESCNLLENTNLSVSQIADAIGMSSATYYTQAFKKHYNCSPSEWRKDIKTKKS